jgi:hypothetical protein
MTDRLLYVQWLAREGAIVEWIRPDRALAVLVQTLLPQQRLQFEAKCCGRIARMLTDRRASRALSLLDRLAINEDVTKDLLSIQPEFRRAAYDAFSERYSAEAIAEFSTDAAYSFARACEHAVYAVGSLFDQVFNGEVESVLPNISASALAPHCHASRAVLYETEAAILLAYEAGEGYTPAYKVARKAGYWASWVEEAAQIKLLRTVSNSGRPPAPAVAAASRD